MRSALLCVLFTLIILRRIHAQNDEFRPTPIPLGEWQQERRAGRAATLHEARSDAPRASAALPAHYWEDALRHSVYLTLVRDKIDQLIAKGEVISPNKPGSYDSKEIDDHDLWDKIKTAPFDRIQQEEPGAYEDVTIMAKGRLLDDKGGFRFAEDERSKEKCSDDDCARDVKALWSVKRVRQRDMETSPGKYHYELTFSVISQIPKKHKKPYENPIRTFTVKESTPYGVVERPQENHKISRRLPPTPRPERAIWVHRNISPAKQTGRKHYFHGLDRIFSSFFSDDDEEYDHPPQKYRQGPIITPPPPYSKIGHVGIYNEQHQQVPYPYRPHPGKHIRPPLPAPPIHPIQHHYLDIGVTASHNNPYNPMIPGNNNNPYSPYSYDYREETSQTVKTTRPAVLPTPLPHRGQTSEVTNIVSAESFDNTSITLDAPVIKKTYNKYKTTPAKANYFPDHVRPPIYNAPPGVFVTMDKKPFKPMPPLKLMHPTKSYRPNRPIDFRPSPQITDIQNTDSFSDNAFRPITMNYGESNTAENFEIIETTKKGEQNKPRKPISNGKKPPKKHDNGKLHRSTTATPDIITAQSTSEEEIETMDWANILGAFTKTTPMLPQTEKNIVLESTSPMTTSTTVTTSTPRPRSTTTTEEHRESTSSTAATPRKRTRPPPKFAKQEKIKKHKRFTTTTTTSTTTETPQTTLKRRPPQDLTPQASSAATNNPKTTKSYREYQNKSQSTTSTTTSTSTTTTTTTTTMPSTARTTTTTNKPSTARITTTTQSPSTTAKTDSTTISKSKNRFRQSTLMLKGTSIKHDRWNGQNNQTITTTPATTINHRRKGSNFHGYVSSSTLRNVEDRERNHVDRKFSSNTEPYSTTTQANTNYDETVDQYETNSVLPHIETESEEYYEDDSKDQSEFIFQPTTTESSIEIISTPHIPATNKTKCKKKKPNISTTQEPSEINAEIFATTPKAYSVTTASFPKETSTSSDIFEEFLNFNFSEDDDKDPSHSRGDLDKEESSNHESFLKIDDFEEFLDMHLSDKKKLSDDDQYSSDEDEDENDDVDDEEYENSKIPSIDDDAELESSEKQESGRNSNSSSAKEKRPYTLLELMAMS